jgi:hypothetical protein
MRRLLFLLTLAALAAMPAMSSAGVPDPFRSIVDPCLTICPLGDIPFTVRVRDIAGNPIINSFVELNLCDATNVRYCPSGSSSCSRTMLTDVSGTATFVLEAGGISSGSQLASIRADGVLLAYRPVASPDQNGDLWVNGTDQGILTAKLGAVDPTGMIACDVSTNVVTQADLDAQLLHMGHACGAPVPVNPQSWGDLKIIYR